MQIFVTLLALAASAAAYSISEPNNSTGWTIAGPNIVKWSMVSTDPANFTIVLSNQASFPPTTQILDALVDGTLGTIAANPPSGGWVAGTGFRVNFVANSEQLSTILAQSDDFTIKTAVVSSSSLPSGLSTASGSTVTALNPSGSTTPTVLNPTTSDTGTSPSGTSGAASIGVNAALFGVVALVGAFLA